MPEKVSVVIPCYNSAATIGQVVALTRAQLEEMGYDSGFVLVNDGSPDDTWQAIQTLAKAHPYVVAIDLARNFGQHNALMAAMQYADGDYVLGMDDDLQTHPSQIPKLFKKLGEGYDLIYGRYPHKRHSGLRNFFSWLNDLSVRLLIGKPKGLKASSFWVCRRYVRDEVIRYRLPYTHLQGLFLRTTNNIANADIEHFERAQGHSNYTLKKLLRLWSGFTNYSILPLRALAWLGGGVCATGFIASLVIVFRRLVLDNVASGWASTTCLILILCGLILMGLGLVGEYIGRIFMCINYTPQYVIRRGENMPAAPPEEPTP